MRIYSSVLALGLFALWAFPAQAAPEKQSFSIDASVAVSSLQGVVEEHLAGNIKQTGSPHRHDETSQRGDHGRIDDGDRVAGSLNPRRN